MHTNTMENLKMIADTARDFAEINIIGIFFSFCFFNKKSHQPSDKCGKKNEDNITWTTCYVIEITENKKNDPLRFTGHYIVNQYTCRHKK